jgi:hypothetical protein
VETVKAPADNVDDQLTENYTNFIASSDNNILINSIIQNVADVKISSVDTKLQFENVGTRSKTSPPEKGKKQMKPALEKMIMSNFVVAKQDTIKNKPAGQRQEKKPKKEPLGVIGFIFAFLGFIPIVGIFFSLLAIIFGSISLSKTKRNPGKYKGSGLATASIVIGSIALIVSIIILVSSVNAAEKSVSTGCNNAATNSSNTRCI